MTYYLSFSSAIQELSQYIQNFIGTAYIRQPDCLSGGEGCDFSLSELVSN